MATIGSIKQRKTGDPLQVSERFWQILANWPKGRFKKIGRITQIDLRADSSS